MATFPSDSPITLVVKAPNQRVGDQTVECFLDWTVKHLKKHLASVYPSKPTEKNQRIIYSGKLLQDNVILKDVLRQHDDTRQHTVHLVCSCDDSSSSSSTSNQNLHSSASTESGSSTPSSRRSSTNGDGVRHRTSPSGGVNYPGYNYQQYGYGNYPMHQQHQYGHQSPAAAGGAGGSNPYYMANAQQQAYWMQQMYAQQYAQYMYSTQYSSSSMLNTNVPTGPAAAPAVHQPAMVANQNLAPAPVAAANPGGAPAGVPPPPNPAAPANQNMRMNAGVGAAVDDDEQEGGNRDWLDWIYTFCRMGVLLSIVYFYSSINRFLVVISAMVFIYLYQGGWFQLQRGRAGIRDPQGEADGNQPQQAEEAEEQQPLEDETDHNTDDVDGNPEEAGEAEEETTDGGETANQESTTSDQQPEEATIPRPGVLATAWVFISTFFTSLLPMDPANIPAAVN